jgi:alkylation response protein AidB-like acyl-CoA dehydrogenase
MGMRGTVNATVEFDTWVGADAMVAEPGRALKLALEALNVGRIVVAAQSSGIALAAFEAAAARAASRQAFGTAIINHQGVGFQLADLASRISASRMLTYEAALGYDRGEDIAALGAQAKLFASETAHDAVDVGVQVFGGEGYVKPSLVERLYRDQRATEIYEGTSEIQRLVLARAIGKQFATAGEAA